MKSAKRLIIIKPNLEMTAWKYMRLSGILLVPLVWIHAILNTLVTGPDNISLDYVALRWTQIGWRLYDILLIVFAFSHGVNGLRQVLFDFTSNSTMRRILILLLFIFWLTLSALGTVSIVGGVEQ